MKVMIQIETWETSMHTVDDKIRTSSQCRDLNRNWVHEIDE